jgi:ribosomal protein S18 acetylase RimI-like enzyme
MSLLIRAAGKEDEPFLYQLAYDHFYNTLAAWAWEPVAREKLLNIQINGQRASYQANYPAAQHGIIMLNDRAVGRILIDRGLEFDTLVDITITKEHRGAGIGSWILRALCVEADLTNKRMRLFVQVHNRARNLYERLGFHKLEELGIGWVMERLPNVGDRISAP